MCINLYADRLSTECQQAIKLLFQTFGGVGGRENRGAPDSGNIYEHHTCKITVDERQNAAVAEDKNRL